MICLETLTHGLVEGGGIFVTDRVRDDLAHTPWAARLKLVEFARMPRRFEGITVYQLV